MVIVEVRGSHEGRVFDERTVKYLIGDAVENNLPDGLDMALMKFKKSEESELTFSGDYAFGAQPPAEYGLPPNATIKYMVCNVHLYRLHIRLTIRFTSYLILKVENNMRTRG